MFSDGVVRTPSGAEHPVRLGPNAERRDTTYKGRAARRLVDRLLAQYIVGHCASCEGPIFDGDRAGSRDTDQWHRLCALAGGCAPLEIAIGEVQEAHERAGLPEPYCADARKIALRVLNYAGKAHPAPELQDAMRRRCLAEALAEEQEILRSPGLITIRPVELDPGAWRD